MAVFRWEVLSNRVSAEHPKTDHYVRPAYTHKSNNYINLTHPSPQKIHTNPTLISHSIVMPCSALYCIVMVTVSKHPANLDVNDTIILKIPQHNPNNLLHPSNHHTIFPSSDETQLLSEQG